MFRYILCVVVLCCIESARVSRSHRHGERAAVVDPGDASNDTLDFVLGGVSPVVAGLPHPDSKETVSTGLEQTPWQHMLKFRRMLGRGSFGVASLYEMATQCGKANVVLKSSTNDDDPYWWHEVQALKHLQHPNIVRMYDYFPKDATDPGGFLLLEPAYGGELNKSIYQHSGGFFGQHHFTWTKTSQAARHETKVKLVSMMLVDTLRALSFMHAMMYLHRDLKPQNIWESTQDPGCVNDLSCNYIVGDLGLATTKTCSPTDTGSLMFTPPDSCWTPKGDVFSLGVTMQLMILTKTAPYLLHQMKWKVITGKMIMWDAIAAVRKETTSLVASKSYVPKALMSLVQRMADLDETKRPTMDEALMEAETYFEKQYGKKKPRKKTKEFACLAACRDCVEGKSKEHTATSKCQIQQYPYPNETSQWAQLTPYAAAPDVMVAC